MCIRDSHVDKAREASHFHAESIRKAINSGVKIAVGTDLLPSDPIDGTTATIRAVSYTHLDVYKRQGILLSLVSYALWV